MQRRRLQIQNMVEDEPLEKRESVEDVLFRELTRGEYNNRGKYYHLWHVNSLVKKVHVALKYSHKISYEPNTIVN